ncbi:hypothetical protein OFY01_11815, partial [Streptomyces sp. GXMU-J5]|nr:hypothetical protein [Streptomyces beihaiensis]
SAASGPGGGGVSPELYRRANAALDRLAGRAEPEPPAEQENRFGMAATVPVPAAAAVVAPAAPVRKALGGGFDFFGAKRAAVQREDLADVVGQEMLAEKAAEDAAEEAADGSAVEGQVPVESLPVENPTAHDQADDTSDRGDSDSGDSGDSDSGDGGDGGDGGDSGKAVIDLTAHDETEQIDVGHLRSALQA